MTLTGFENIDGLSKRAREIIPTFLRGIKAYSYKRPVKSPEIERNFHLSGAEVRAVVSYLRCQGEPIGSDSRGYFYAVKASELDVTIEHMEGREFKIGVVKQNLIRSRSRLSHYVQPESIQGTLL